MKVADVRHYYPHSNLPPARGKELFYSSFLVASLTTRTVQGAG